jgi:hypothetical protein
MKPLQFVFWLLVLGCGGGGNDGPIIDPPELPEMAGLWSGTENVIHRSGDGCHPGIDLGSRSGDIFNVTQTGGQILIQQLVNCVICRFTGTISESGSFQALGTVGPATARVTGQVTGKSMNATKVPLDENCDKVAEYDLTRP